MADRKHLEILKRGVEEWNQRRDPNPYILPYFIYDDIVESALSERDLTESKRRLTDLTKTLRGMGRIGEEEDLAEADLSMVDITRADLSGADLSGADLSGADLSGADFRMVDLTGADFSMANLRSANLRRAHLRETNFRETNLRETNLSMADLRVADLSMADLNKADLNKADLRAADLVRADLTGANLTGARLTRANLAGANLTGANLSNADLSNANLNNSTLQDASLQTSWLMNANFDRANLTRARLWATQRTGWSIKGVTCESIYWDEKGEEESFYLPGEFERLFADKTKVKLFYKGGINPLEIATIPALIKHLEDSHPGCGLRLVSIHEDSGGVVVELAIEGENDRSSDQLRQLKAALEAEANQKLEYQRQDLIERENYLLLQGKYEELKLISDQLIARGSIIIGDIYNVSGQAGAVGRELSADQ